MSALGLGLGLIDYVVYFFHAADHVWILDEFLLLEVSMGLVMDSKV